MRPSRAASLAAMSTTAWFALAMTTAVLTIGECRSPSLFFLLESASYVATSACFRGTVVTTKRKQHTTSFQNRHRETKDRRNNAVRPPRDSKGNTLMMIVEVLRVLVCIYEYELVVVCHCRHERVKNVYWVQSHCSMRLIPQVHSTVVRTWCCLDVSSVVTMQFSGLT